MTDIAPEVPAVEAEVPVVEPVEAPTPVVEVPLVEAPTHDWADEAVQQRAAQALQHLDEWGDPDTVKQAIEIQRALQTDEGISKLFLQAGAALGLSYAQMDALFGREPAPAPEPEEEIDPERVLTYAEAMALVDKKVAESQQRSSQQLQNERSLEVARTATQGTLAELKVTDENEVKTVLTLAQAHVREDDLDPEHIKAAIRKGHAEYEAIVEKRAQAYLETKRKTTDTLPTSTGGPSGGGEETPEPKTVEEGIRRARRRFALGG